MMSKELQKRIYSSVILFPLSIFFIIEGSLVFIFFLSLFFLIAVYEWILMSRKKNYFIYGLIFLVISFFCSYNLRNHTNGEYNIFLFVFLICVSSDIGGYLFGKIFKGPKLTKISPKKTFAGVIGGYLLSILFAIIFFTQTHKASIFFYEIIIISILISTISQLGDILISYFKRLSKIKDTGKIIPGHGGLLDRIDGMIFAFPFTYLILKINIFSLFS